MPSSQVIREKIETWKARIEAHSIKIQAQAQVAQPRYGLIRHWLAEIHNHIDLIETAERRLPGARRGRR